MEDDVVLTVRVRGIQSDPQLAAGAVITQVKRAMFLIDGLPGQFCAEIEYAFRGMPECGRLVLADGEWRRERDSNPRGD